MAVYERTYRRFQGRTTPEVSRFLVLPRYAFADIFQSKLFTAFFSLCFGPMVVFAAMIYVSHNTSFLAAFPDFPADDFLKIDAAFFSYFMEAQRWLAFFVALFSGPGLISRDLANNALPLYLSRPLSRSGYVLGKFSVLAILLSAVTWVPAMILFLLQTNFAGMSWAIDNARFAAAAIVGSLIWIVLVSFLALSMSAWVRWRPIAGFMMFAILLAGAAFRGIINLLFRTGVGDLLDIDLVMDAIFAQLIGRPLPTDLPMAAVWAAAICFCAFFLLLLRRKINAYEVVS